MAETETILSVKDLQVRFRTLDGMVEAVKGINLACQCRRDGGDRRRIRFGQEPDDDGGDAACSPPTARPPGHVDYRGHNLLALDKAELNNVRGRKITMIFQEPMTSLDPLYTIGNQLIEPIRRHRRLSAPRRASEALELLDLVQIPDPERRMKSYPHEMSGGQRQRVMIAMALANDPDILIADEPTTALDVTIQAQILALLADLQQRLGMAIVFITHDLGIVRRFADRVYVMQSGEVVEEGDTETIFAPSAASLHARCCWRPSRPAARRRRRPGAPILLEGRNVEVTFKIGGGFLRRPADDPARGRPHLARAEEGPDDRHRRRVRARANRRSARALLRLLPSEGGIRFEGRDISKRRPRRRCGRCGANCSSCSRIRSARCRRA